MNNNFNFVAQSNMLTHDVKGAVGNMVLFADLLKEEISETDEEARDFVKHIDYTGKKLILLLETWTELTERLSGSFKSDETISNASSVLEKVFKTLRFELHQRNVILDIRSEEVVRIPLEEHTLEKLIGNLVLGFIAYMDPDTSLTTYLKDNEENVTLSFESESIEGANEYFERLTSPISTPSEIDYTSGAIKPTVCGAHFISCVVDQMGGKSTLERHDSQVKFTIYFPKTL